MSNNLAALMFRGYPRPATEQVYFITEVVGDLHYDVDGIDGVLRCGRNYVALCFGEESLTGESYFNIIVHYSEDDGDYLEMDMLELGDAVPDLKHSWEH